MLILLVSIIFVLFLILVIRYLRHLSKIDTTRYIMDDEDHVDDEFVVVYTKPWDVL